MSPARLREVDMEECCFVEGFYGNRLRVMQTNLSVGDAVALVLVTRDRAEYESE